MTRSFDFFDTLVVRRVLRPEDIFRLLEHRLVSKYGKPLVGFADRRRIAELSAKKLRREQDGGWEVTLSEIYDVMRKRNPSFDWDTVRELEIEIEVEHILPIVENLEKLKADQNAIVLSDTYFSSTTLERLLTQSLRGGAIERRMYTSCELRENKHSGKLYSLVAELEHISVQSLSHLGDNKHSDVKMALREGVTAEYFSASQLTRYEQHLGQTPSPDDICASLAAGASRAARLTRPTDLVGDQCTIWDVGCNVIGPALLGFVLWVLKSAEASGAGRIYFLSRDGQILHKLAAQVVTALNLSIECSYLYVSRQALHLPSISGAIQDMDWEWLFEGTTFLSLRTLFARAGLDPADVCPLLPVDLIKPLNLDQNLAPTLRTAIEVFFRKDMRIQSLITEAANRERIPALGYFNENGLLEPGKRFAVVDMGWNGRLQRSLSKILSAAPDSAFSGVDGYYFGLVRRASPNANDALYGYAFTPEESTHTNLANYRYLLEIFTAGDHGSCVGYGYDEHLEVHVPRLETRSVETANAWGVQVQQQAILKFSEYFLQGCVTESITTSSLDKRRTLDNLATFFESPTRQAAEAYGKFQIFEDQGHSTSYELAPPLSTFELVKIGAGRAKRPHGNFWHEASLARRGRFESVGLGVARKILRLVRSALDVQHKHA